ncbi:MAG: GTPase [Nostoc sp.]|uniref:GTPase n=1 Tax=Nostoc sp. TaxID=1180 RepID=UPI002FFD1AF8
MQQIQAVFQDAFNSIPSFAEEHWDASESQANQGWEQKLKTIRFEQRLRIAYEESSQNFNKEIGEILEEVGNELQIVARLINNNFKFQEQDTDLFLRDLMKIGGNILVIAASIIALFIPAIAPVAAVAGIISFALNQISGWTKSKEQKRREHLELSAIRKKLRDELKAYYQEGILSLAFIGQYNAGKSTTISALTGRRDIRIDSDIATDKTASYDWNSISRYAPAFYRP